MARSQKPADPGDTWDMWIAAARLGTPEALGQLLGACQQYLLLVAQQELGQDIRAKVSPSDLVQETFLEAKRDFEQFRGWTERDLQAWLRKILINNLANCRRKFQGTDKRDLDRELPLANVLAGELGERLLITDSTPSAQARKREQDEALQAALGKLSPRRQAVIRWRHQEGLSFVEIGRRLGLPANSARMVWARAVESLRQILDDPFSSG